MAFNIRPLVPADQNLTNDFFRHLSPEGNMFYNFSHCNENGVNEQFKNPNPYRVDFAAVEKQPDGSEIMIGHIYLWDTNTKLPWIGICLREGSTGKHLGSRLLQYLEDWCKAHACGGMLLTTHTANIRAQMLYRNFGFKYLGIHGSGEFIFFKPFPQE